MTGRGARGFTSDEIPVVEGGKSYTLRQVAEFASASEPAPPTDEKPATEIVDSDGKG